MSRFILISIFCLHVSVATSQNFSNLSEDIKKSHIIVDATIVSEHSFWDKDRRNIYTSFEIKVNTFLKGNSVVSPEIIIMGGKIDDLKQIVSTSPNLNVGDYGIFMLFKLPKENRICSDSENKYLLTRGKRSITLIEKDSCKIETLGDTPGYEETINCIEEITGKTFQHKKLDLTLKSTSANQSISNFSPKEITAGTDEVLRIFGTGFGNTQGTSAVWFKYADNPNQIFTNSTGFKVILWSDEEIRIVVPSNAATGKIFVDINGVKAESKEELKVKFNVQQEYYKPQYLINKNDKGGYTFHLHSNVSKFVGAKEQIEKSIKEWICSTSVPWEIGNSLSVEYGIDDICTVQFGDLDDTGSETLGRASIILQRTSFINADEYVLKEVDVVFSQKENWCFNSSKITQQQVDFLSVALHEFGHAHFLGHVNDADDLMHYAIAKGEIRDIGNNNVLCGKYVINQSLTFKNEKLRTIQIKSTLTPVFSIKGDTLHSNHEFASYQWLLNGTKIANATKRSFVIVQPGSYSLQITDNNNCIKLSASKYVDKSGSSLISFTCPPDISKDTLINLNERIYVAVSLPKVHNPGNEAYTLTNNFNQSTDASGLYPIGKTVVTWKLTDKDGFETTCSHNITITKKQESILTMICPPNIELNCLDSFPEPYTTLSEFEEAGGLAVSSSTYVIDTLFKMESESQDPNYCQSSLTRIYSIPDYDGNYTTCSQEVAVIDSEPPILYCPSDLNIKNEIDLPYPLKDIVEFIEAGGFVYDFCTPSPLLHLECQTDTSDNNLSKRLYSFTDICGNTGTCIQNIAIEYPTFTETHLGKQKLKIKTYPNPANDDFTLNISGITNSKVLLEIYSSNGIKVFTHEFYPDGYIFNGKINLSEQPRGSYQIKVIDGEYVQTSSLIIQ